ncbi:NUDIX hydrolase [Flavobacterium zepuense]|uniref:NUDIX hydrolase n=1 Tax=Flavobacterium zepuense TaxID=2593302 RepID=A0A552V5N3_9FLAO|nr:NUDIX hydrolase [Flavobacterium zepuense]TRW25762.1 NUDIX hydrolase [Flavobacterium zepuense]
MHTILDQIKKLKALADTGLLYASNDYDRERYTELHEISLDLMSKVSGNSTEALNEMFAPVTDYPTVKTDVRALVLSADKKQVLLARESADGKWSLPGGWADVGQSPREVAIKEVKEETGLDVMPKALLAVFDKRMHPHPPQPFYVYKMVILCEATSVELTNGFDMLDAQYFDANNLPELSTDRILKRQIDLVYQKAITTDFEAYFD